MSFKSSDVTVIGGGILGSICALTLVQKGAKVTLLEKNRDIGMEASGVNAGTISMQVKEAELIPLRMKGLEYWQKLNDLCGEDVGLKRLGGLSIATVESDLTKFDDRLKNQHAVGLDTKMLSREEIRSMRFLSDNVLGAIYCDLDSYCDPRVAMLILKRALIRNNVCLRTLSEVRFVEPLSGDRLRITLADDSFETGAVVLSAGVWTPGICTGWFKKYAPMFNIYPRTQQMMVTEAVPKFIPYIITDVSATLSLKQYSDGKVVIGGAWPGLTDSGFRKKTVVAESLVENCATAIRAIRGMENINLIRSWVGVESESADLLPILGPIPSNERIFLLKSGFAGYTMGPYLARVISEMVCGNTVPGAEKYSVARFQIANDPYAYRPGLGSAPQCRVN